MYSDSIFFAIDHHVSKKFTHFLEIRVTFPIVIDIKKHIQRDIFFLLEKAGVKLVMLSSLFPVDVFEWIS